MRLLLVVALTLGCGEPSVEYREPPARFVNSIGMEFVRIPAGEFSMGSADSAKRSPDSYPRHRVRISRPYALGVYEVTQRQFDAVMPHAVHMFSSQGGEQKVVEGIDTANFPVDNASWLQAHRFCEALSLLPEEAAAGRAYRLPTEAEWEYACRAGTETRYAYVDSLTLADANVSLPFDVQAGRGPLQRPQRVGAYRANGFGLHDMHGNVWEWCLRGKRPFTSTMAIDPVGDMDRYHAIRGGAWDYPAEYAQCDFRQFAERSYTFLGFRVVCELKKGAETGSRNRETPDPGEPASSPSSPPPTEGVVANEQEREGVPAGLRPLRGPADNRPTAEKIALGRQLFFDPRLSANEKVSCATCHDPRNGWSNGQEFGEGVAGLFRSRHVPTLLNVAYVDDLFWDGRTSTLEEQALAPFEHPQEMGLPVPQLVEKLNGMTAYREAFVAVFGEPPNAQRIAEALASFERTLLAGNAPYDRFRAGDAAALSDAAKRGHELFFFRAHCGACHSGPLLADGRFHNTGIGMDAPAPIDPGRFAVTQYKFDQGAFRTPTLRDIGRTAPYMHDGRFKTLEEVVDFYDQGGIRSPWIDERMNAVGLTDDEKKDLVAFMKEALASEVYPHVDPPPLLGEASAADTEHAAETASVDAEAQLAYEVADPQLRIVPIDSSDTESFLSVKVDSAGRLFVGGREALFVYEPTADGRYARPVELYRFPADSWIYDIEIRGPDLYAMTNRALYLLPGAAIERTGIRAERLISGHPAAHVHQCFHGLAWGPDGDLYFSMGDLAVSYGNFERPDHWAHWTFLTQPQGAKVPFTGVGGFLRCRPDGSRLEVVARGTRNSCGLAFDRSWNLFSHDNDHEGLPTSYVPGRLLHVAERADFGWPRGWMPSITPDRADLLETMSSEMGRAVPVGQSYYDDDFFPEAYRQNLLVARWDDRTLTAYPIRPRGASFVADQRVLLRGTDQSRPVGVAVGRGGRIFVVLSYMAHNEGSPTYKSDLAMITRADDGPTHPFDAYESVDASATRLWTELASSSVSRSQRAFVELMRRGGGAAETALERLLSQRDTVRTGAAPEAIHWIWLAAGNCAHDPALAKRVVAELEELARSGAPGVRRHAVQALTRHFPNHAATHAVVTSSLNDDDPQALHAAIVGSYALETLPLDAIARSAESADTYLRQAATQLLAEKASLADLENLLRRSAPTARLAGVLAAGFRLTIPRAIGPLPDKTPLQPWPDESVYHVAYDRDETVDVRTQGRTGMFTMAELWRATDRSAEQDKLFELLVDRLGDDSDQVRLQAAYFLSLLDDERAAPLVEQVRTTTERQRLASAPLKEVGSVWTIGPFADANEGFGRIHPPEEGAVDLTAAYADGADQRTWETMNKCAMFDFLRKFGAADGTSRYVYFRFHCPARQQILLTPGSDDGLRIWHNGKLVYETDVVRGGLPLQDVVYLDLEAGSNDVLMRVRNIEGEHNLYLHYRSLGAVSWSLPEKLETATLAERLLASAQGGDALSAEFAQINWIDAADEGDFERGRILFSADGIGCAKCHSVDPTSAAAGGPSLIAAGSRFTVPHLVESILIPSKQVAPEFAGSTIVTEDGLTHSGLVVSETADEIVLLAANATKVHINKAHIEERKAMTTSPMPQGLIKAPGELRDLLAFLKQLKQQ